jgi:hypothetical protein
LTQVFICGPELLRPLCEHLFQTLFGSLQGPVCLMEPQNMNTGGGNNGIGLFRDQSADKFLGISSRATNSS